MKNKRISQIYKNKKEEERQQQQQQQDTQRGQHTTHYHEMTR
jgi:hypothetical protein